MEEEMPVDDMKIKVEEPDLEEAFNEIMGREEIINDELIQDEIIKNEMLFDDINGDNILGDNDLKEVENHLQNGDSQFQNLVEKYTQIRKMGPKSRWLRFRSSLVKQKRLLLRQGDGAKSDVRNKGGTQRKVPKSKAKNGKIKKSKAKNGKIKKGKAKNGKIKKNKVKKSKFRKIKGVLKHKSETNLELSEEDGRLRTKEFVKPKQEPQEPEGCEDRTSDPNPDTSVTKDSDEMLYCDECSRSYEGDCPEHGPLLIIEDTSLPDDLDDKNRAEKTSPPQVSILNSEAENGVWARDAIPARTRFGPFEGKIVPPNVCTAYSWLIRKDGQPDYCVDATEPSLSNWMRYVNCARHNGQQNLHAFQYEGKVFYRTIRAIDPGEELLVWFGEEYGRQLGINLQAGREGAYTEMCPDCPYPCASPMYLLEHKKLSHENLGTSEKSAKKSAEILRRNRRSYNRTAKLSVSYRDAPDFTNNHNSSSIGINVDNLRPTTNPNTGERCYACPECNKFILRRSHLKRHLLIHSDVKPYFCDFCNKGFSRKDNFDAHMKLRHAHEAIPIVSSRRTPSPVKGSKPIDHSKERTSPRGHLTRRQQVLIGKNQFSCNECDMRFSRASEVRAHMAAHESDKPLGCDICKKRFINKAGLASHQKTVHKTQEPLFKPQMPLAVRTKFSNPRRVKLNTTLMCKLCGLQCRSEEHLTTHEHTHDDRFSVCFVCSKKFSHVNHLKRHLLIHAGYRPHGCPHCGQDFSRTEHLKRHIRTHTRQGAYECSKCKKRFAKKMDFDRHVRLHNKDAPCLQDQRLSMNINLQRQLKSYLNDEENFNEDDCDDIKQEVEDYEDEDDEPLLNVFPEVILGAEN